MQQNQLIILAMLAISLGITTTSLATPLQPFVTLQEAGAGVTSNIFLQNNFKVGQTGRFIVSGRASVQGTDVVVNSRIITVVKEVLPEGGAVIEQISEGLTILFNGQEMAGNAPKATYKLDRWGGKIEGGGQLFQDNANLPLVEFIYLLPPIGMTVGQKWEAKQEDVAAKKSLKATIQLSEIKGEVATYTINVTVVENGKKSEFSAELKKKVSDSSLVEGTLTFPQVMTGDGAELLNLIVTIKPL